MQNRLAKSWMVAFGVSLVFIVLAGFLVFGGLDFAQAGGPDARYNTGLGTGAAGENVISMAPNCPLPVPAPTCTPGQTLCSEGNGQQCHATVYTCGGTPPVWGPGTQCTRNACTGTPGTTGSECQKQ